MKLPDDEGRDQLESDDDFLRLLFPFERCDSDYWIADCIEQ